MSGVNAAATLTLEVNTGSAEEKLNALEQRINKLDGTHEVKIKLSGGDASQATKVYEQASRQISDYAKSHPITIAPFKMEQQGDIFGGLRTKLATELEATKKSFEAQIKSLNEQLAVLTAKGAGEAAKGLKIGLNAVGGSASSVFKLDEGQISKLNERMKQVGIESSTALEKGLTKTNFAAFNKVLGDLSKGTEASLQKVIDVTKEAQLMVTQLGGKQTALDTYGSYIVSGAAGTEASRRLTGLRSASAVMADWKDEEATAKMELAEAKKVEAIRAQVTQTIIAGALAEAARREDIQSRWDKRNAARSMASAAAIAAEWKDEEATAKMELAEAKKVEALRAQVTQTIIAGALAEAARREDIQSRWDKRKATRSMASAAAIAAEWKDEEATAKMELAEAKKVEALRAQVTQTIIAGALAEAARREDIQSRWDKRKATRSMAAAEAVLAEWRDQETTAKMELAEAKKITAIKEQTDTEFAKWAVLDTRQKAKAALQAARVYYAGGDTSKLSGAAALPQALSSAQQLGSLQAAEQAFGALAAAQSRVGSGAGSVSQKLKEQSKHMWDLHSAARGLTGGLGALWLTYGSTIPLMTGAALSGGFITAMKAGSEFAYQLTFVKALGGETAESIAGIGKAALSLSKTSMYGPVELANGLRILSQAGLSASDSLLALPQAMSLATVGEMNMEQAAITLTGVMNAFNLGVGDMAHIGDVFAKAAALSQTSVQGMTEAMKTASVVGEQYGASMEDTATALTLLAKVNISGTAAGTALRNMLKELYSPTAGAAKVIKQLGLETKDAMGNMKSFPEIIYQLKGILAGYDKASQVNILQALFGERGAKEAIAMLGKTREQWDELNKSISESDGFMRKVSAELESTASGMFKQAFNTMQANLVGAFDKSEGVAKQLAVALRDLADSAAFKDSINAIVEGVSKLATILVEATPILIRFGEAWLLWKSVGLVVGGVNMAAGAIRGLGVTMAIVSAEAALAGGGLAGLRAALLAAGGAAGVAAGATGVGMLSRVLSVMTSPITAVVVGLGGLAYAINEYVLKMPAAVDAANTFVDSLDRESKKLREEIELLEKKNRLQLSGKSVDTNAAEQELANIVKNRDDAISRKNDPKADFFEKQRAEREYTAFVTAEMSARGKLRDLENDQVRYNAANLVSVLQSGRERLKDIQADADAAKKKVDTSGVEALLNAYEGKKLSGSDIRAVQKELDRRLSAAGQSLLGSGTGKWEAPEKTDRSAQKDERRKFEDNLSSNMNREKLRTDAALLEIEQKLAEQAISSAEATYAKHEANRNLLQTQKEVLEAALAEAVQREDSTLVLKTWNDLQEKEAEITKQAAAAKLELTKMRVAEKNAIEDISKSSARYSEDLQDEISYLGKTALEVRKLRIEKQRLRDIQDIDVKQSRNAISADEAKALKEQADAMAKLDDAEASRQMSFVGGWQKAYDENLKNITDMSKRGEEAFKTMSDSMSDALATFVSTGKLNFSSLANSIISDIIRMQARAAVSGLLGTLGGFLGFGSSGSGATGLASLPSSVNRTFANGGVFENSPSLHAYANQIHDTPKFFAFAQGGVFGEAGPEAIMPLKRGADGKLGVQSTGGSGAPVTVNVINNTGAQTKQTERPDGRGGKIIDILIEQVEAKIAGNISTGNGPVPTALQSSYGLNRTAGAY